MKRLIDWGLRGVLGIAVGVWVGGLAGVIAGGLVVGALWLASVVEVA